MTREQKRFAFQCVSVAVVVGLGVYAAVVVPGFAPWGPWSDVELGCPKDRMSNGAMFDDDGSDPFRHPDCRVKPGLPLGLPDTYYFSMEMNVTRAGVTRLFSVACRLTCDSALQLQEAMHLLPTVPDLLHSPGDDLEAARFGIVLGVLSGVGLVGFLGAFFLYSYLNFRGCFDKAEAATVPLIPNPPRGTFGQYVQRQLSSCWASCSASRICCFRRAAARISLLINSQNTGNTARGGFQRPPVAAAEVGYQPV